MNARISYRTVPLAILLLGLVLGSCDQGTLRQKTTPEQARDRIESALDELAESLRTLEKGAFSTTVKNLLGLDDGTATSADWAARLGLELKSVLEVGDDGRFRFEESTGVYAWDADEQQWVQTDTAATIILQFPATEDATSNNATLQVRSYADEERSIDGESVYLPARGTASLSVDDTEVYSATLADVAYTSIPGSELPIPTSLSLDVLTAPHTHRLRLEEVESGQYSFSAETRNDDQLVSGLSATVDAGFSPDGPTVRTLSGEARIGSSLTLPYTIDVDDLIALDDPSEQQLNDRIDARIEYEGEEIATLRYDGEEEEVIVVYSDGTEDSAAFFYEDFLEELRSIWSDYLGSDPVDAVQKAASGLFSSE